MCDRNTEPAQWDQCHCEVAEERRQLLADAGVHVIAGDKDSYIAGLRALREMQPVTRTPAEAAA